MLTMLKINEVAETRKMVVTAIFWAADHHPYVSRGDRRPEQRPSDYQSVWSGCSAGLQSNAIRGIDIATRRSWESRARATYCYQ